MKTISVKARWLLNVALGLALVLAVVSVQISSAAGTISLTTLGIAYTQDFNTLASTGTSSTVPTGWDFSENGTNANTTYTAGTGSGNAGDTYSFGAASNTERAFGGLLSGSLNPTIGAQFTNNTGGTITSLAISFTGEMWRAGVTNRGAADRLDFQLSTNATSLTTGTWTDYDSLDFNSPNTNTTAGALNGNAIANRTAVSFTITGLSIANEASFWIRWADFNIASSDDGLSVDDFSLTPNGIVPPIDLTISDVSANEGNAGITSFDFTVSLAAPAGAGGVTFDIATQDDTATVADNDYVANSLTGQTIPAGSSSYTFSVSVNGDTTTESDETFFVDVTNVAGADNVLDSQGQGTIVNDDVCDLPYTPIYNIQGSGLSAAITGTVTTKGVVVGDFEGTGAASGFYIQDLTGDGDTTTSDGIFVYTGSSNLVSVGQVVRVTGYARERFNQTTLNGSNSNTAVVPAANIVQCGTGSVTATDVMMPFADANSPERYEGMLVRFPQALVIAEYFNYDRFGEIVLAQPLAGEARPFTGTAIDEPGAPANARTAANTLSRITLDDVQSAQNPSVLRHPNGQPFSLTNRFRGGDTVQNAVGVLGFDFSLYRIVPTGPADYNPANPRPASPEPVGGTLRVAAMNTLNYFVTLDPLDDPTTPDNPADNICGPTGTEHDCRGADLSQPAEFTRQRDKLLQALAGLDADIIGLNELENTLNVEPLADIVAGLPGYAYIDTGVIGTDAIKVGMIYRPAAVTPVGAYQILDSTDDPRFIDTKSRPSLAQTFEVNATSARFTVVVNHLKSKGSDCLDIGDPDLLDGQGNCSQTRRAAAEALVDWLATDPTGSGDPDFIIMGDLNSYAQEDTIDEIKAGSDDVAGTSDDFINLIAHFQGAYAYSYTFDGQAGYLDHALANASLFAQITGAVDWHINSDEPDVLDYDTSFKPAAQEALYEVNAYRTSDHDPVVVGLIPDGNPVISADPASQTVQYSDPIAGVTITASDVIADIPLFISTQWKVGDGAFADGLPAWLTLNDVGCDTNISSCTWTLSGSALTAPGTYVVRVKVSDKDGGFSETDITIEVIPEDARATYTGVLFASTASTTSSVADVTLAATVQDISVTADANGDVAPGDIRNAMVTFVDRENGNAVLCEAAVGLVDPTDLQTGTATCTWTVDLGSLDSIQARIGIVVGGYYLRNSTNDDAVVTISKALANQFITGGGYLVLEDSAGQIAGDDGTRANFGFNVKYNQGGKNLNGRVTILVRRLEADGLIHVYQIKSNAITSLAVNVDEGTAVFNGKANITDVTDPVNPISIAGNATLQVIMIDNGEPGADDTIGITLWKKNGGLWFASKWDGTQTVQQALNGGNLVVR